MNTNARLRSLACPVTAAVLVWFGSPASAAQERHAPPEELPVVVAPQVGRTADSAAGRIGQRQSRESTTTAINGEPLARIGNRIANRVQSRIRNRIDQNYDPRANATSPFVVAGDRVRAATGLR